MQDKLERAKALRKLFERQRDKVGDRAPEDRDAAAGELMDGLVGPEWRVVITLPDGLAVDVPGTPDAPPPAKGGAAVVGPGDPEGLMRRVRSALSDAGEHPEGYPEPPQTTQPEPGKGRVHDILCKVKALLAELGA